jgi:menaquinone-dependent protoporphyrinogen IX oxidase
MEGTTMARLLVVYAAVEGHTRKVAERVAESVRRLGHTPVLVDGSTALPGVRDFVERTGWTPTEEISVAGALVYTKYDYLKRLVMKLIADRRGGDTDTAKDNEYTDWAALDRFAEGFVSGLSR